MRKKGETPIERLKLQVRYWQTFENIIIHKHIS
jgi:hypothetical protein